jgi:hypothetical protein
MVPEGEGALRVGGGELRQRVAVFNGFASMMKTALMWPAGMAILVISEPLMTSAGSCCAGGVRLHFGGLAASS